MPLHRLIRMDMQSNSSKLNWLAMGDELISCLKSKGNHRLSRYDAFIWLVEHIQSGNVIHDMEGKILRTPYSASYKRLAEEWNWDRETVQIFINELCSLSVINAKRDGNAFVFSFGTMSHKQLLL